MESEKCVAYNNNFTRVITKPWIHTQQGIYNTYKHIF